mmetsp:Transcript_13806/g.34684  ORF Transcript_13806/g.34684 Transcript_13806/m.34684 type:complete len:214 (-) Transcript_13806:67-708(-)|eukprot:CAMPEP_0116097572 /NCGR_PEP_ID=MMETSP0327-20121206/10778_1 /TAXON_ID=44447 /ORGANISM="Pseudo-nitzschia delicatissima, Strain B596" /LENGTH=213 /DNA_ID=CAMNT_0003589335 /DNA_START=47 /DNA_END=688 /DNA_ORIENTATION=+
MAPTYRMYTPPGSLFAFAPLVVSEYAGVSVEIVSTENFEEAIASKSPTGKAPILETKKGEIIFSSQAIARFLANLRKDSDLLGEGSVRDVVAIEDWTNWAAQELELPVCVSYYMATGCMRTDEANFFKAKQDIECALGVIEAHLEKENSNYLVLPEHVTLSDIVVACYLVHPFTLVFDEAELKRFPRLRNWFLNCMQQQEFSSVLGKIECGKK